MASNGYSFVLVNLSYAVITGESLIALHKTNPSELLMFYNYCMLGGYIIYGHGLNMGIYDNKLLIIFFPFSFIII